MDRSFNPFDDETSFINPLIERATAKASKELASAQEQYILSIFGSAEAFAEVAHLYVIENGPIELGQIEQNEYEDTVSFRYTETIRIRPKTPEELDGQLDI